MFAFAVWDEERKTLFCGRDRFGIKPFYYAVIDGVLIFASEAKAIVPFLPKIETNKQALSQYLSFQYTVGEQTLFEGIKQLMPAHSLTLANGEVVARRYWDLSYDIDFTQSEKEVQLALRELVLDSISVHCRSDVPVASYLSGGVDSSLVYRLSRQHGSVCGKGFHGRFTQFHGYDESSFAKAAAHDGELIITDITSRDFEENIAKIIYALDFPVAGPGVFPQYMVSKSASSHVKVVLGGQGGDEIFGGYARYVVAYLEQCLRAAIDGTYNDGDFAVTMESIIPNLGLLREYKPMIKMFWKEGLFGSMDERYFRLINRSNDMRDYINPDFLNTDNVFEEFAQIFNNPKNVKKEAYFDKMTHFDFKCLLPALLHVEDRVSMAHGIESRVPLIDQGIVEHAATVSAEHKFKAGQMKFLLKETFEEEIPAEISNRRDKMGFPVPLTQWLSDDLSVFFKDINNSLLEENRNYIDVNITLASSGVRQYSERIGR